MLRLRMLLLLQHEGQAGGHARTHSHTQTPGLERKAATGSRSSWGNRRTPPGFGLTALLSDSSFSCLLSVFLLTLSNGLLPLPPRGGGGDRVKPEHFRDRLRQPGLAPLLPPLDVVVVLQRAAVYNVQYSKTPSCLSPRSTSAHVTAASSSSTLAAGSPSSSSSSRKPTPHRAMDLLLAYTTTDVHYNLKLSLFLLLLFGERGSPFLSSFLLLFVRRRRRSTISLPPLLPPSVKGRGLAALVGGATGAFRASPSHSLSLSSFFLSLRSADRTPRRRLSSLACVSV